MGNVQSCDRNGSIDSVFLLCSHPPRPPAARGAHRGTEGRCSLSRRQTSPNPRGPARTHSNTAAATDTINHQRREGQRGDTLSGSLPTQGQRPPAGSGRREQRSLPRWSAVRQLQVWLPPNQLLDAANAGFTTKGRGITLARSLSPPGRNTAHDSGYTARQKRQPGSGREPPQNPPPHRSTRATTPHGAGHPAGKGQTSGEARWWSAVLDREGHRG